VVIDEFGLKLYQDIMANHNTFPQTIKNILGSRSPEVIPDDDRVYKHACVLIPVFLQNGEYRILFTKRTSRVEHHKGQISFPGGSVEKEDQTFEDTALREAREEIGLRRRDVKILGRIDDALTVVSDFVVHPVVGLIPHPYDFRINRVEVKRIIVVPITVFHPENFETRRTEVEVEGFTYRGVSFEYHGDIIWGATARMMDNFVKIIGDKLPLPESHK
jgi:8-oxo-dGTP pyrophosphatase MutT (NUDIX family)